MEDFQEKMTITLSGKTRYAMLAFLERHNADKHSLNRFIDESIQSYLMKREMDFLHLAPGEAFRLFPTNGYEATTGRTPNERIL